MTIKNLAISALGPSFAVALALMFAFALFADTAHAEAFDRELEVGMSGPDVSALQTFLALDPTIYPEGLVTGYFGSLTKAAVARFQSRNGISAVGRMGPITIAAINRMSGVGGSDDVNAPVISVMSVVQSTTSATVTWTTNEGTLGTLYYSHIPIYIGENRNTIPSSVSVTGTAVVSGNSGLRASHSASVQNLQANTTYYYVIHGMDQAGNVSVTWPWTFRTN